MLLTEQWSRSEQILSNMHKNDIINIIKQQGLVPLYYHDDPAVCVDIIQSLYEAGVRIIEFTNRGSQSLENFRILRKLVTEKLPGMCLGIGTIKTEKDADDFINAGADFIVCPIIHPGIAKTTHDAGLLWIPGCLTTTEIALAEANGASLVKIYPGSLVGPSYIGAIKEIFPALLFMPTGGVELEIENLRSWFDAGVVAVGMGSKLISKKILANKEYNELVRAAEKALDIIHSLKK